MFNCMNDTRLPGLSHRGGEEGLAAQRNPGEVRKQQPIKYMYVYIYIYIYICIHICVYIYIYKYICVTQYNNN